MINDDDERKAITLLLIAYQDILAVNETDIGRTDVITHDVGSEVHGLFLNWIACSPF